MDKFDVYKFDSVLYSSPEGLDQVINVIASQSSSSSIIAVAAQSSREGNGIHKLINFAITHNESLWSALEDLSSRQYEFTAGIKSLQSRKVLEGSIREFFKELEEILKGIWLVQDCSKVTFDYIRERASAWTAKLINERLLSLGKKSVRVDSRDVLVVFEEESGLDVDWEATETKIRQFSEKAGDFEILVASGSSGSDRNGRFLSLGVHGAELAACIYGSLFPSSKITFWTNSQGVMSADPLKVPGAVVIPDLSYEEATELAHFGAEIIHPEAIIPAIKNNIPLYIKNINDPNSPGTVIHSSVKGQNNPVKGFSIMDDISLLDIEGSGMIGVAGISSRLFSALFKKGISVILISQASSEHSICCAIPSSQVVEARSVARMTFAKELDTFRINKIDTQDGFAILGAVGDQMSGTPGISANFFGALGKAGVNVRAIAQGSSERNISAVVNSDDAVRALRAVHSGFYLSNQTLGIGIIGPGLIGSTLLDQIAGESDFLKEKFGVDLRVRGITRSKKMVLNDPSLDMSQWRTQLEQSELPGNIDNFVDYIDAEHIPHKVIIDCTSSSTIPENYISWIKRGIHIITPNKKAGTTPMGKYRELFEESRKRGIHFLYETTVGAGLPIIGTLRDLILTGDTIRRVEGVFSGTLAYLFWRFDGTKPFSTLVSEAKELGFTEPDPRDDLSGMDIVRKTVILAREIGYNVELDDVPVKSLVPEPLENVSVHDFMERLHIIDEEMDNIYKNAKDRNEVVKYTGIIDEKGQCSVQLKSYPMDHPFAGISGSDNIVAFTTDRYNTQPLVVRGPGAGPEVTAGGIFADLLRLASYLGARL